MHRYKELRVWQASREMVKEAYLVSKRFPNDEVYNLTSQLRRAAVSVMLNIGEGAGRRTNKDFANFLSMASGSAIEVENILIVAFDQSYIDQSLLDEFSKRIESISNMIFKLQESLDPRLNKS